MLLKLHEMKHFYLLLKLDKVKHFYLLMELDKVKHFYLLVKLQTCKLARNSLTSVYSCSYSCLMINLRKTSRNILYEKYSAIRYFMVFWEMLLITGADVYLLIKFILQQIDYVYQIRQVCFNSMNYSFICKAFFFLELKSLFKLEPQDL